MTTEARSKPGLNKAALGELQKCISEAEMIANNLITAGTGFSEEIALVVDVKRACARALKTLNKGLLVS